MLPLLEKDQIDAFLNTHIHGSIRELTPVGKGGWSQAFSFRHEATALVVRFGEYEEDYLKDRRASLFSHPDLPIPQVREIGQALGRHFCISERAYGAMLESLDAVRMGRIVPAVFRALDALRTTDVSATTGFGGWNSEGDACSSSWKEYLLSVDRESERVHGWHLAMAESSTGSAPYNEALEYLKVHIHFCSEIRHLIHNDLLHFNVLVTNDRINAVVDWGNSLYGDFLYELAVFTFYAPWYPAMNGIDWALEAQCHFKEVGCDVPYFAERLRCYQVHLALGDMAYNAFIGRWKDLADVSVRVLSLIRQPSFRSHQVP